MYDGLRAAAPHRAAAYVARHAGGDAVRGPILRHWYQRCYLAALDAEVGLQRPLQAVTAAEAREVAVSVELGRFRRIIGGDGIPLVTAHGTALTEVDRRLAAAETGVIPPPTRPSARGNRILRLEVTSAWNQTSLQRRGSGRRLPVRRMPRPSGCV